MRDTFGDCTPLVGTHTHFDYNFIEEGVVDVKFLTCICDRCSDEKWDKCVNLQYVGESTRHTMERTQGPGVREGEGRRKERANKIADELTGAEDTVALYTDKGDWKGERMWLMKPKGKPEILKEKFTCPVSGEGFDAGERVLQGEFYKRLQHNEQLYELMPCLGIHTVPVNMLRAGGTETQCV